MIVCGFARRETRTNCLWDPYKRHDKGLFHAVSPGRAWNVNAKLQRDKREDKAEPSGFGFSEPLLCRACLGPPMYFIFGCAMAWGLRFLLGLAKRYCIGESRSR